MFNHPNKGMPVRDITNPGQFGQILSTANAARVLEFVAEVRLLTRAGGVRGRARPVRPSRFLTLSPVSVRSGRAFGPPRRPLQPILGGDCDRPILRRALRLALAPLAWPASRRRAAGAAPPTTIARGCGPPAPRGDPAARRARSATPSPRRRPRPSWRGRLAELGRLLREPAARSDAAASSWPPTSRAARLRAAGDEAWPSERRARGRCGAKTLPPELELDRAALRRASSRALVAGHRRRCAWPSS